ncbi:MAG: hypothetical protein LBT82_04065 [Oscillospiraceae bacterium]|nr:hypothetical protein [Oscillospiraceae bacterium]
MQNIKKNKILKIFLAITAYLMLFVSFMIAGYFTTKKFEQNIINVHTKISQAIVNYASNLGITLEDTLKDFMQNQLIYN